MAILYSYPLSVPERTDLIIGTKMASSDTDDLPITQNYSIGSVLDMITTQTGAQTFNQVTNVGSGVVGGNTTTNLITFTPIHVKGSLKDSLSVVGTNGQVLSSTGSAIKWIDSPSSGVTAVTGTAPIVSSGGTTPVISLANTTVTAGVYTNTDLTVDAQGRITAAASGTLGGVTKIIAGTRISISPTGGTGDVTVTADADTITSLTTTGTSGAATLSNAGVLNVPNYADTDVGITTAVVKASTVSTGSGISEVVNARELELYPHAYAGGTNVGFVPTGGTGSLYLKGDGTWASIPTGLQFKGTWDASGGGGGTPDLTQTVNQGDGFLWITSVAGTAYPNGGSAAPSTWNLGDWAVYVGAAGSGTWTRVPATNAGVTSFVADSTNSTYLSMTPTTAGTGAVELDADLSATAVSGNIDNTKFLRGDNKWAVPSYTTDTNTTYTIDVPSGTTSINLAGSDSTNDPIVLTGGTNVTLSRTDASTIDIAATDTNTTYDLLMVANADTTEVNPTLRLDPSTGSNDDIILTGGANMTITRTSNTGVSFVATDTQENTTWYVRDSADADKTVNNDKYLKFVTATGALGTALTGAGSTGDPYLMTLTSPDSNTTYTAGTGLTLTGTVFSADVDATQANDDTVALSATANRFYGVQLDNDTTVADAKLVVNVPWTDTMGTGFTVSAGTNTATTTITAGDTLTLAQGTNVTTVSDPDGTITINSTDEFTGTVKDVALTHYGDAFTVGITDSSGPDVAVAITQKVGATAADYINGIGNIVPFPTIPTGTVKSVACSVSGDAYTATVTDPNVDAVIAIAPQGDATQYINGAGDLVTLDDLADVTGRGASTSTASTFSGGLTANPASNNDPAITTNSAIGSIISLGRNALPTNGNRLGKFEFNGYSSSGGNSVASATISASANIDWVNANNYDSQITFQTTVGIALRTALTSKPGLINVWGTGSSGGDARLVLNCYNNNHGQTLSAQPHSEAITNTMLLPKGANSTLVSEVSASTLTNKSGSNSQWTNDEGYITSYTETDTLATVTGRGASTSTACTFSNNTTFGGNIALSSPKAITWNSGAIPSMSIGRNYINFSQTDGTNSFASAFRADTNGSLAMSVENNGDSFTLDIDGNLGLSQSTTVPAYRLDVNGTIRATGDVIAYSDVRVKENIKTIDNSLEKVSKLRGVEFNKIGDNEKSIGVIAQEIEDVIPEVVKTDDQGMKSVAYGNISGLLIEAIKELKQEVEELKKHNCNCKE